MSCSKGDPTFKTPCTYVVEWNLWLAVFVEFLMAIITIVGNLLYFVYSLKANYFQTRLIHISQSFSNIFIGFMGCGGLLVFHLLFLSRQCSAQVYTVYKAFCHYVFLQVLFTLTLGSFDRFLSNFRPTQRLLGKKQRSYFVVFISFSISSIVVAGYLLVGKTGVIDSKLFGQICSMGIHATCICMIFVYLCTYAVTYCQRNKILPMMDGKGNIAVEDNPEKQITSLLFLVTITTIIAFSFRMVRKYFIAPAIKESKPDLYFVACQWVDVAFLAQAMLHPFVVYARDSHFKEMVWDFFHRVVNMNHVKIQKPKQVNTT